MSQPTRSATDRCLGTELAHAVAARDAGALRGLLSTPVTFRAVTPRRFWEADTAAAVVDIMLGTWFAPDRQVTGIASLTTDTVGDVHKVSYRLMVSMQSGPSVIEQVVFYIEADGQIIDLRLVCSGFLPV